MKLYTINCMTVARRVEWSNGGVLTVDRKHYKKIYLIEYKGIFYEHNEGKDFRIKGLIHCANDITADNLRETIIESILVSDLKEDYAIIFDEFLEMKEKALLYKEKYMSLGNVISKSLEKEFNQNLFSDCNYGFQQ